MIKGNQGILISSVGYLLPWDVYLELGKFLVMGGGGGGGGVKK